MSSQILQFAIPFDQGEMLLRFSLGNGSVRKYTWNSKRHCNADYELHVILGGECTLDVEEQQYKLCAGQAALIAPGKYHKPYACPGEFERFSLSFTISGGSLLKGMQERIPQSLCFSPSADFLQLCSRIVAEGACKQPFQKKSLEALLTLLAIDLIRDLQLVTLVEKDSEENLGRTDLIDNYFERHFAENHGCAVLADQLHVSGRQLNRILKEHYGMGFKEKIIQARMDHAALLLRTTSKCMQDIIELVGYCSPTAFYKAFRLQFGMTPQQYRHHSQHGSDCRKLP